MLVWNCYRVEDWAFLFQRLWMRIILSIFIEYIVDVYMNVAIQWFLKKKTALTDIRGQATVHFRKYIAPKHLNRVSNLN